MTHTDLSLPGMLIGLIAMTAGCAIERAFLDDPRETVMEPGMTIVADTEVGVLTITALTKTKRRFQWDDHDHTIDAWPRQRRFDGRLGLVHSAGRILFPGPIRVVYEEAQRHYDSREELLARLDVNRESAYTEDGFLVGASKTAHGISVAVSQYMLNGAKPHDLPDAGKRRLEIRRE